MRAALPLVLIASALCSAALTPLTGRAQATTLLNISDSTYPSPCSVAQYLAVGVSGLTGSETLSQFAPAYGATVTSPVTFTNGGQKLYFSGCTRVMMLETETEAYPLVFRQCQFGSKGINLETQAPLGPRTVQPSGNKVGTRVI